jgi:hypothetical protein
MKDDNGRELTESPVIDMSQDPEADWLRILRERPPMLPEEEAALKALDEEDEEEQD